MGQQLIHAQLTGMRGAIWQLTAAVLFLWASLELGVAGSVVDPISYLTLVPAPKLTVAEQWKSFKVSPNHEQIVAASPDIWTVLPKEFEPGNRNPCWTNSNNSFRCIPYFQIIGVSKCGTTDMFARLKRHPELADGTKGPHWWDECPYPARGACTAPPRGDFDGYTDLFEKGAYQMKARPTMITGEASSNTFTGVFTYVRGPVARRTSDFNVNLAELIHEAQPYQRLIILMREPVSRYYSAFHYYGHRKADGFQGPEKFHQRAVQDIARWKDCVQRSGEFTCVKRYEPQQLVKGMYSQFVEAWTKPFPRDQLLFLRNEDYQSAAKEHLQAVIKFLGVRDLTEDEWLKMLGVKRTNAQSSRYPKMLPETAALLKEFYRPYNEKLAQLLADDRYLWKDEVTE
eukprot:CAMPEP_0119102214 /NCGR_PEP_ID=MMETSP1180-20130426/1033_1 /TAXON_ID=3052 ORGANISM="Chlamydomonas cf sp, Strain CCMP681" /NCGR_SAMPLE_ID=MMETSP1180 /ASSEMBLY_ACC=CAM_ASM_000741 /LENGTH=399 /DNA_ID=CAMNT_0007086459 /DNA_START=16 /DNA_END=1215 /DNA_ORIENTATION=-